MDYSVPIVLHHKIQKNEIENTENLAKNNHTNAFNKVTATLPAD